MLELWGEYQTELGEHGVTDYAKQLDLDIWQAMRLAPAVDMLPEEKIHRLAYANTLRPIRLTRLGTPMTTSDGRLPPHKRGYTKRWRRAALRDPRTILRVP